MRVYAVYLSHLYICMEEDFMVWHSGHDTGGREWLI
jgi:hypothetical protein